MFITNSGMAPRIGPAGGMVNSINASPTNQQRDGASFINDPVVSTRPQYFPLPLVFPVSGESEQPTSRQRGLLDLETLKGIPESNLASPQVSVSYLITAKDVQPVPRKLVMSYTGSSKHSKCGIESFEGVAQSPTKNTLETLFAEWVEDMDLDSEDGEIATEDATSPDRMDVHADTASKPGLPSTPHIWAKVFPFTKITSSN